MKVGGRRSADRQRHRKKKHLIEAALFGRLDQMLRRAVQGGVWGTMPPSKNRKYSANISETVRKMFEKQLKKLRLNSFG